MNNNLISIIIPIYKAEQTIHRCLDSILAQTYQNFELILIDDGSPDNSGIICDEYAKKDKRIVTLHQQNQGVSVARQKGHDLAKGEWTIHCDPDDWIEPQMLQDLIVKANETCADIVWCDFFVDNNNESCYSNQGIGSENINDFIHSLSNASIMGSLYNKLIRSSLYVSKKVKFDSTMTCCEDLLFTLSVIINNPTATIIYYPKAYYHYWQNPNSILHTLNPQKTIDIYTSLITKMNELISPIYRRENDFFFYKRLVIGALYQEGRYAEMLHTYPEIHTQIFKDMSLSAQFSHFALCLRGYPKIGEGIERVKQLIKNIIYAK